MLKSISFKKLTVLSAGIAIVLSSCGLQNSASESSGTETAAGKTKNFALLADGTFCYDTLDEQNAAFAAAHAAHDAHHDADQANGNQGMADPNSAWWVTNDALHAQFSPIAGAQIGGCPAPAPEVSGASEGSRLNCIKPAIKKQLIDGYTEQLARPLGGEVTEAYLATMQKGLDVTKATCTN
jgi:hypothetical protein